MIKRLSLIQDLDPRDPAVSTNVKKYSLYPDLENLIHSGDIFVGIYFCQVYGNYVGSGGQL